MALINGYVAYGTGTAPSNLQELAGGSYARGALTYAGGVTGGTLSAPSATAPGTAGTYNSFAIFDAATGGDMLFFSPFTVVSFAAGATIPALNQTLAISDGYVPEEEQSGYAFAPGTELGQLGNGNGFFVGAVPVFISGAGSFVYSSGNEPEGQPASFLDAYVGTPTDVPVGMQPGQLAARVDPVNNKIWVYTNAGWKGVAIA